MEMGAHLGCEVEEWRGSSENKMEEMRETGRRVCKVRVNRMR